MSVRKIPKNYLFVTGGYSSRKNEEMDAFESLLEKDYLLLLDFDDEVKSFDVQPVRIPVVGVPKGYVPDVFIEYRADPQTGEIRRPSLVEVKTAEDLVKNAEKYAPKFAAANIYAKERGWEFRTVDQNEIRSPRLANLKFLREYRNFTPQSRDIQKVQQHMAHSNGESSLLQLVARLAQSDEDTLYWLPILWSMLLTHHLAADLDKLFTNDVPLWLPGSLI